ncbi:MAG: PEGA domain-containing protein [Proteobacteria bacterium]|jgi:hypothetical protein|nr:PEGA domain-containing protein [Pseudomonadota bacterium]
MRVSIPVVAAVACLAWGGHAAAQTSAKDEAKRHFANGVELAGNENFAAAAAEFEVSVELYSTKMGLFNLANAYKALYRYGDALEMVDRLEREFGKKIDTELRKEIEALKESVQLIIGWLDVRVDKEGAAVRVDDLAVGASPLADKLTVGPGDHVVEAALDGFETSRRTVKVASGDTVVAEMALVPVREEPPAPAVGEGEAGAATTDGVTAKAPAAETGAEKEKGVGPLFWVALGGTVVAGALSGVFYGLAAGASKDFDAAKRDYADLAEALAADPDDPALPARDERLWSEMEDASSEMSRFGDLGLGFGIAAGALAVATVVVGIVQTRGDESAAVEVAAAPGGVSLAF